MTRTVRAWCPVLAPLLVLGVVVWRVGTGPVVDGLRSINVWGLVAAAGIALITTVCCAWRWTTVARGFGVELPLPAAVAAYYRSQFLNVTVPGGIVGDVHRGVRHGREAGDLSRALRAVVLERLAGQVVQILLTVIVLLALPSPVQPYMPLATIVIVVLALIVGLVVRARSRRGSASPRARAAGTGGTGTGLLSRRAWLGIALASAVVVAGHALTFLIAARSVGTTASASRLLPIALLAMMAMTLPSVGGWGPREGVSAWAFGAAGLGIGVGVATGVVYGVMVLVATLPGAVVLLVAWFRQIRQPNRQRASLREGAAHA